MYPPPYFIKSFLDNALTPEFDENGHQIEYRIEDWKLDKINLPDYVYGVMFSSKQFLSSSNDSDFVFFYNSKSKNDFDPTLLNQCDRYYIDKNTSLLKLIPSSIIKNSR